MLPMRCCQECDSKGEAAGRSVTRFSSPSATSASLESTTPEGSVAETM